MLTAVKQKIAHEIKAHLQGSVANVDLSTQFDYPKDWSHGHLALPVFQLAKELKKAPPLIAKEIATYLQTAPGLDFLEKVEPASGFVNFTFKDQFVLNILLGHITQSGERLGFSEQFKGKKLLIDYSSPNVAKPMHIGHLRATVIGQALRNLAQSQGFDVVGVNHLGDWGSQFGKLCFAFEKWGQEFDFKNQPFESLYQLYVKFHQEAEAHPELEAEGAAYFKRLEDGDPKMTELWKQFIQISMEDFKKNWKRLGVKHDLVLGESFYNDKMDAVVAELARKHLLVESEGALVVPMDGENESPCLIKKSDGASLYATRDLATAIYRMETLKADVNLYVVGADQGLHFKQVFAVLRKMGKTWVDNCHHIGFGLVRFKDLKISSRKGQIIRFADVLDRAVALVKEVIQVKNPDLKGAEADDVAEKVAVGAIIFNDLVNDRIKNTEFDWDRALSFEGDSGPYVQYVFVRCQSILEKWGKPVSLDVSTFASLPDSEEERILVRWLMAYPDTLANAYKYFKPNLVANYLLDLCGAYNRFYHNHKILGGDEDRRAGRLALVKATQAVIDSGLKILNMPAPNRM